MMLERILNFLQSCPRAPTFLKIWNPVCFVFLIIVNVLSSNGVFGIGPNSYVSGLWNIPITPAGYTFSIWWFMWIFQASFVLYSLLPIDNDKDAFIIASAPFSLLWLGQSLWVFVFGYNLQVILFRFVLSLHDAGALPCFICHYADER
jgi:benzodiazapine receptor